MPDQSERDQAERGAEPLIVCPFLRLKHDTDTAATYARRDHVCAHAHNRPIQVDWQHRYCLTSDFKQCPLYSSDAADNARSRALVSVGKYRRELVIVLVLLFLILVAGAAFVALGGFQTGGASNGVDSNGGASSEVVAFPTQVPRPTPQPSPAPTATPPAASDDEPSEPNDDASAEPALEDVYEFADDAFRTVWNRLDLPVLEQQVERSWLWGPEPISPGIEEPYDSAPDGTRLVQYFDKARMEIIDPDRDTGSEWFVTGGLLVSEMVEGQIQVGVEEYDERDPADIPIVDAFDITYADIHALGLVNADALEEGETFNQEIHGDSIEVVERFEEYGVTSAVVVEVEELRHAIASVFWEFVTGDAVIWSDGAFDAGQLFETPFFLTGYPITEAYWMTATLDGTATDILWQCFERRCLTYTPDNEPDWQVESNNTGRHYYDWRYGN